MDYTLKAVIIELSGGNVRNSHIRLRGAFGLLPDDCLGGSNQETAGKPVELRLGREVVFTDIDGTKAILSERGAIRRMFEAEGVVKRDLILIERLEPRPYRVSKASKRGFRHYL
jgi:hypothetical protein